MEDDGEEPPLAVAINGEASSTPEAPPPPPVGVTVIIGYLGAGKSTFVNHIIKSQVGKKIAVILNEFGEEIGVERAMINEGEEGAMVEEWVELDNGCICCTVKHSLVQALEQTCSEKRKDVVILNKVDQALSNLLKELEDEIRSINSLVKIVRATRCQVDPSSLLDCQAYDAGHIVHLEALLEENKSLTTKELHDAAIRTICISEQQKLDLDKVRVWLEEILWDKKYDMDVYRCKGVLSIVNSDKVHTLQLKA